MQCAGPAPLSKGVAERNVPGDSSGPHGYDSPATLRQYTAKLYG